MIIQSKIANIVETILIERPLKNPVLLRFSRTTGAAVANAVSNALGTRSVNSQTTRCNSVILLSNEN